MQASTWPWFVTRLQLGASSLELDLMSPLTIVLLPACPLLAAVSDGRHFAQLGIQTYGFLPMRLPEEMRFMELIHAEDERIPVAAVDFGTHAIRRLLERLGQATERTSAS